MPEADQRLRQVAQLRRIWRALRDAQERREDEEIARPYYEKLPGPSDVREPHPAYSRRTIRALVRRWWCAGDYAAIIQLGQGLDPVLLDEEPLVRVYLDEATAALSLDHLHP